ncbi:1,4-dihydroxy-2-naphthoate octaprenyltransferase [Terasakiella sp. A23]|uniref:1,4-dihydroxy-2-naphthoate octaprenyltransferase n=1 Tax=Terasakiella sp. FCG-A23 TaxID=3080561 RepID=UPI00295477CC|nr:1,4-dihydroxy-2-naphthoate octaprenyltransferase [Terasakiella sp. A23]MDV7340601.1 1,4-dihydroxy-2-naphthoate octaprenyltransferase [Terasakiella sp. A23]
MHLPKASVLWLGIRPKTLTMSLMPVLVAFALALSEQLSINYLALATIILSACAIQIATNLHNDAQDFINKTDTSARIGPLRITQAGLATAEETKNAAHLFIAIAALCGAYLVFVGGISIMMIGIVSLLAAYGYSSGPYPISRSPFGEVFVLVFFGLIAVSVSYYLITGIWSQGTLTYGLIVGSPACAVLLLNNYRDLENDTTAGRKTLAIMIGSTGARWLYVLLILLPYPVLVSITPVSELMILPFAGMIIAIIAIKKILSVVEKTELNKCLVITAASQTVMSIGLSAYLVFS